MFMNVSKEWDKFLQIYFNCSADKYGNRACDYGTYCDSCQGEWVQKEFEKFLEKNKKKA